MMWIDLFWYRRQSQIGQKQKPGKRAQNAFSLKGIKSV
jgi:hypothetical protein